MGNSCNHSNYAENETSKTHIDSSVKVGKFLHNGSILGVTSLDATRLVTCSDDCTVAIFDISQFGVGESYSPIYCKGHEKSVNRVAVHNGSIWSASRDLSLRQWDPIAGGVKQIFANAHTLNISAIAGQKASAGNMVFSGSRDYHVKGWDIESGRAVLEWVAPRNIVTVIECNASAPNLVYQGSEDLCVRVWDVRQSSSTQPAMHIGGYVYFPLCMDINVDGHRMITGCKGFDSVGCDIKLLDLRNPSKFICEYAHHAHDVNGCRFSSNDSNVFVSVSKDGSVCAWNTVDSQSNVVARHSSPLTTFATSGKNLSSLASLCELSSDLSASMSSSQSHHNFAIGALDGSLLHVALAQGMDGYEFRVLHETREYFRHDILES